MPSVDSTVSASGVARRSVRVIGLLVAFVLGVACTPTGEAPAGPQDSPPAYVGATACRGCHEVEFELWQNSHHALAMQHVSPATVLGDFSEIDFRHFDLSSTFFRRNDQFIVRTDNADGDLQDFVVKYTFGVTPLQQYLVEFPGGRLQTLPFAWDSRSEIEGGQRWFHIYPNERLAHDDELHWTGREQNWNYMCAECHSTNIIKHYNVENDSFNSTWSEINVSCEACHGPASRHVAQAEAGEFGSRHGLITDLDDTGRSVWEMNVDTGIAVRSELRMQVPKQPEACGRCHSRRSVTSAEYTFGKPLLDTHLPVLLDDTLYFPDGQIQDEVYVYGSFLQSRMYRAGVTCSDCHEPHSGVLRTGSDPNEICATCHLPARFANTGHHRHQPDSAGCVDCHMPSRDYMVVDGRRDHSFRLPRPDLTVTTGSPNACNQCHVDETPAWALSAVQDWYGMRQRDHVGFAIHAARVGDIGANDLLIAAIRDPLVPGIAKGTALTELRTPFSEEVARVIQSGLASADPFVRIGALRAVAGLRQELQVEWAAPLLQDRLLAVRIEAARAISPLRANLHPRFDGVFKDAEREAMEAMRAIAERPEAHGALGGMHADAGNVDLALTEFENALRINPKSTRERANFADLYRRLDRDGDAELLLREGIDMRPDDAALRHSLGLLLVRQGHEQEGLEELRRALEIQAENPRYLYVYAIALNSLGQTDAAAILLTRGKDEFPADFDIQWGLATMLRDRGESDAAREIAEAMVVRFPGVQSVQTLLSSLR